MSTDAMTLSEFAAMLSKLADRWNDEEPVVMVGDIAGNMNVSAKDGFTKLGPVGYAAELFETNGVLELGNADWRLYGTVMVPYSALDGAMLDRLLETNYEGFVT